MDVDAIVLAGGRGSRLGGVDKAALEMDGETLLARTLRAVARADRVIIVGDVDELDHIVVREEPRFAGPAAAIGAGLAEVRASHVLVLPCDQPFVHEAVDVLIAAASGDGSIAIDGNGRRQHLMAVLRTDALRASVAAQSTLTDLSVRALLDPLDLVEVAVPARSALDIDTWHDRNQVLAQGGGRDG
jgi:molybdopterin-guanine dinucleotide biosynthesis protein A